MHFMAERSHFYNLSAYFLNIIPKPDMIKISFFPTYIPVVKPKKRINFTSKCYESLKVIIKKLYII